MAGNITTVSVGTSTAVAITATVVGATIQIGESVADAGYPTSDYILYHAVDPATSGASVASAVGRRVQAGQSYTLSKTLSLQQPFYVGQIVCFVKAVTATFTMVVDEQGC